MLIKKMLAVLILLACFESLEASSYCSQSFEIYGKTDGKNCFLFFDVFINGECGRQESYVLSLEPDKYRIWSRSADYYSPDSISHLIEELDINEIFLEKDSVDTFYLNDTAYVSLPVYDSTFQRKFYNLFKTNRVNAKTWSKECPVNCLDTPQFEGVNARLIYTYSGGIYKNYTFKKVLYYPQSHYLIVLTDQKLHADGGDTIHGMMIFYLEG